MPETFSPATWADGAGGGTPITAAQLNRIEQGVETIDDRVAALEAAGTAPVTALSETTGVEVTGRVLRLGATDFAASIPTGGPDSAFVVVDKLNDVNDASVLFRSVGVQKAEIGLPGDNDLHLKTVTGASDASPTYTDSIICKNTTGLVFVPQGLGVGTVPAEKLHVIENKTAARATAKVENTATSGSESASVILAGRSKSWYLATDVGLNGGDNFSVNSTTAGYPPRIMCTPTGVGLLNDAPGEALDVAGRLVLRATAGTPTNPGSGGVLYTVDGTTLRWRTGAGVDLPVGPITASTKTASYTLVLGDAGTVVEMSSASATTLTVPPNSSVAFPVGTTVEVFRLGAGAVTLAAGAGVTLRAPAGLGLRAQYSSASLRKRATDEWVIAGDTA